MSAEEPLHRTYPVSSYVELTLRGGGGDGGQGRGGGREGEEEEEMEEKVRGVVYCTDETSSLVVLRRSLVHTTLASEVRMVSAGSILACRILGRAGGGGRNGEGSEGGGGEGEGPGEVVGGENGSGGMSAADLEEMARPIPLPPTRKVLEEREKRSLRLATESLRHVNRAATPEGQACFDRLLKACNEVTWGTGTTTATGGGGRNSIVVLRHVRVDPPYGPGDCHLIDPGRTEKEKGLNEGSLERVRKIVAHGG